MDVKGKILGGNKVFILPKDDITIESEMDEVVQSLKTHLSRGVIVPLICEDMYEYVDPLSGEVYSLHEYIVEQVISRCKSRLCVTECELDEILSKGYYGMELLQDKLGTNIYEQIYLTIFDENKQIKKGIHLKPKVKDFLDVCQFPLIITTSCFPIIESELKGYHSNFFLPESRNDEPISPQCVYHIFGEAMPNNENWGYNERQILKFLKYAYSSEYCFTNLISYMANNNAKKSLLVLGNDTPDWLFRFILSPIYPGDVYDNGNGFYMTETGQDDDHGLNHFLRRINFKKDSKIMDILEAVTHKMSRINSLQEVPSDKEYGVFLSHASEDNDTVKILVNCLRSHGIKVWVDYEGVHDGQYWDRIINGMRKSKFFMSFITESYIMKTKSQKEQLAALRELGITELLFNANQSHDIDCKLGGVALELILAEKMFTSEQSLPIILANSTYFDEPLVSKRVDNWGKDSKRLPESLFYGITMFEFDENMPENLKLEWSRYQ